MKNLVTFVTFSPLLLGLVLALIWCIRQPAFEPALTALGLFATITGIFVERWASANEKRREFLHALLNECMSNAAILSDPRFTPKSHGSGQPIVFPRLIMSVTETAIASDVFAERKDRGLFSLLHQWRDTVNEFNRRLDITELRTFINESEKESRSLYEALRESKEFNDALILNKRIESVLKSKYKKGIDSSEAQLFLDSSADKD